MAMTQTDLFDRLPSSGRTSRPTFSRRVELAPAQEHSASSVKAAEMIEPHMSALQGRVLAYLKTQGVRGATDEQMQIEIPIPASTQRPRRIELVAKGLVRESGRTGLTRSGRKATVWVVA